MSLVFIDGFDDGQTTTKWDTGQVAGTNPAGRNGNGWQGVEGDAPLKLQKTLPSTLTGMGIGFAFKASGFESTDNERNNTAFLSYYDSAGNISGRFGFHNTGAVRFHNNLLPYNGGPAAVAQSTTTIPLNVWVTLEFFFQPLNTGGRAVCRLNGSTILDYTGDTVYAGAESISKFMLQGWSANYTTGKTHLLDDLWVISASAVTDLLGDCAVETIYPNGDGASSQWVGSDSDSINNSLLVDEPGAPVTTDYVQSDVSGNTDTYAFQDLTRTAGSIKGVQVSAYAAKSDAGSRSVAIVAHPSTTDYAGSDQVVSTTYTSLTSVWETNPDTSAAWTIAQVNSAQFGVRVRP